MGFYFTFLSYNPPPSPPPTQTPIFGQFVKFADHLFILICSTFKRGGVVWGGGT